MIEETLFGKNSATANRVKAYLQFHQGDQTILGDFARKSLGNKEWANRVADDHFVKEQATRLYSMIATLSAMDLSMGLSKELIADWYQAIGLDSVLNR
jgi:hypothetical protein